jgi:cell wall-associated NlpC family hydrolase
MKSSVSVARPPFLEGVTVFRTISRPSPTETSSRRPGSIRRILVTFTTAAALVGGGLALTSAPASADAGSTTLWAASNEGLSGAQNQGIFSPSREYEARMQNDGNFVVYGRSGAIWSSNTRGSNARLVMQSDGNLVMYSDSGVLFTTNTQHRGGNRLVMQDDGNLVMYGGGAVWASKGSGERAIQWFYNNLGRTDREGLCELAVEESFGTRAQYNRAIDNWNDRVRKGQAQTPYTAAPRGSLVFIKTSTAGHVAVSLGNGKIVSTSAGGRIGIVSISYFTTATKPALGWAFAPW